MTTNRALQRQLSRLRDAFIHGLPFCQGVVRTSADDLELFYGKGIDVLGYVSTRPPISPTDCER